MPFITYPQANGQVAVIIPTGAIEDCIKDVPDGVPYKIVDDLSAIDNDYFNAYDFHPEDGAEVNIEKAKGLHLNKFREARKPLLESLDIQYMRALETEDSVKAAAIALKKQELRDVTKTKLPSTLSKLKEVWPDILNP
jgi:gluconate kinase